MRFVEHPKSQATKHNADQRRRDDDFQIRPVPTTAEGPQRGQIHHDQYRQ